MIIFMQRCETNLGEEGTQEKHRQQVRALNQKIKELEEQVASLKKALQYVDILEADEVNHKDLFRENVVETRKRMSVAQKETRFLQDEYDVIQYNSFTNKWIYTVNSGVYGRVLERISGVRKQELQNVLLHASSVLAEHTGGNHTDLFIDGIYKTEPGIGTRYEIYYKSSIQNDTEQRHFKKVVMFRPFSNLHHISTKETYPGKELIHFIMPLSGRLTSFKNFMDRFVGVCVKRGELVFLTVALFGNNGKQVKEVLDRIERIYKFGNYKLLQLNGSFSRGKAIQAAVDDWHGGNTLMFFCDIDLVIKPSFLSRCRLNTESGNKVYYPIVFSLYNPDSVYTLQDWRIPRFEEQVRIASDHGFWRDFGYGMTCQYTNDFRHLKGFQDDNAQGWGTEDTHLYRKYLRSNLTAVRSVDHGIFHIWHDKICDSNLSYDNFKSCIMTKGRNEASHGLMGLIAFSDEVLEYKKQHGFLIHPKQSRNSRLD